MNSLDMWPSLEGGYVHSLNEMLANAPERMRSSFWGACDFVYPNGDRHFEVAVDSAHDILRQLADEGRRVSFAELLTLSEGIPQIIWASMPGFDDPSDKSPWIVMSAVDSSFWRFETDDMPTRNWVRSNFDNVRISQG